MARAQLLPYPFELPAGQLRPMTRWGEPVLHRRCEPVEVFDDELAQLVADMFITMYAADGVGLAANQVGVAAALFVFDVRPGPDAEEQDASAAGPLGERMRDDQLVGVVVNPTLTIPAGPDQQWLKDSEGCLSLPGSFVPCKRALLASVTGVDHTGAPVAFGGTNLLARCLQHESDHLRGVVFGDLVPSRLRKKLESQANRSAPEFPVDWPVTPRRPPAEEADPPDPADTTQVADMAGRSDRRERS